MQNNAKDIWQFLLSLLKEKSNLIILTIVLIVLMIVIPLPGPVLDFFLALNMALSLITFLSTLYIKSVSDLTIFPSLLLITTILRLALNISSTKLILLLGKAFNAQIIKAFGNFVVGGNYIVGLIIFLILIIVQLMVITKGATRVSEVAARFTLDGLPVKLMSVDAQLQQGQITEEEAKQLKKKIQMEADFYAAMDGASKFVQGDAIAGLIITAINIVGGLIIGVWMKNYTLSESLRTYTLLTVGDGLTSQLPALFISISAGIIVTRAASEDNMGKDILEQLLGNSQILLYGAMGVAFLALIPGFPKLPFLLVASILGFLAHIAMKEREEAMQPAAAGPSKAPSAPPGAPTQPAQPSKPQAPLITEYSQVLNVDLINVEIGIALIELVKSDSGNSADSLSAKVSMLRRELGVELGIIIPKIRLRDNLALPQNMYVIKIKGIKKGEGILYPNKYFAAKRGQVLEELSGIEGKDPIYGVEGYWIDEDQIDEAELNGYLVIDPVSLFITHLQHIITRNAAELFVPDDAVEVFEDLKKFFPKLASIVEANLTIELEFHQILQLLLAEEIPIRNGLLILEAIKEYVPKLQQEPKPTPEEIVEHIRLKLAPVFMERYIEKTGYIYGITPTEETRSELINYIQQNRHIPEEFIIKFQDLVNEIRNTYPEIEKFVFIIAKPLRRLFAQIIYDKFYIPVVSEDEILNANIPFEIIAKI